MSKKDFDYCCKKAAFRKHVSESIRAIFSGELPENKIIVDTAGEYSLNIKATAFYQLLKSGVISSHKQFIGIDDESKAGKISIVETNKKRYGENCKWHIPCELDKIENFCLVNRDRIGFICLDLQGLVYTCLPVLQNTMIAMKSAKHKFGICFNSIFSLPWNMNENLIKDSLVEEAMEREFQAYQSNNPDFVSLLQDYKPLSWFWYEGCGKSNTILGSYVFERK